MVREMVESIKITKGIGQGTFHSLVEEFSWLVVVSWRMGVGCRCRNTSFLC